MTRVKLRCIMGCPGLKNSYQEKGLLVLPTSSVNKDQCSYNAEISQFICKAM